MALAARPPILVNAWNESTQQEKAVVGICDLQASLTEGLAFVPVLEQAAHDGQLEDMQLTLLAGLSVRRWAAKHCQQRTVLLRIHRLDSATGSQPLTSHSGDNGFDSRTRRS